VLIRRSSVRARRARHICAGHRLAETYRAGGAERIRAAAEWWAGEEPDHELGAWAALGTEQLADR